MGQQPPPPSGPEPSHYRGFTVTLRHTTLARTPLDEWSARCRDVYVTTHSTEMRQLSFFSAWFETATPASQRPQTHTLDRAANGTSLILLYWSVYFKWYSGVCDNERCYNEQFLSIKFRMLQRTRRNTIGRRSTRVRMMSRPFPALISASVIILVLVCKVQLSV
jgi:hypothetical protein